MSTEPLAARIDPRLILAHALTQLYAM